MGESDRYQEYKKITRRRFTLGQPGNALFALFAINVVMFFIIVLTRVFFLSTHQGQGMEALEFSALRWFAMPASITHLSETPWTILTFMFPGGHRYFSINVNHAQRNALVVGIWFYFTRSLWQ